MILSIVQLRLDDIAAGRQDARTMDAARKLLVDTLARRPDLDLKNLSLTIGRNHAYLQQYLMRGSPRELPEAARHGLAALLGVSPDDLRSTVLPMGGALTLTFLLHTLPGKPPRVGSLPMSWISEYAM